MIGRLGEGGMGTVYLAQAPDGLLVAIKVVRTDLADDEEFRRRFRSEVDRARQVPPFCTAEVLDADPDHEMPYFVVEYVDGPSLATVVRDKGPLSQSNLHGLAIGVATALTAIHGAGVIHRDLKPNNVLLAAGSPKVIDFGIAHSVQGTSGHTRTDQIVGTISYMAPERFGSAGAGSAPVTPAADIFSWGAVIAYAGTGRTPFGSDAAPVVAARILTSPPDLTGLSGMLRGLVEQALAKDPADRPTARELLEQLLGPGPARSPDLAAALARQPDLLVAAEEAQATGRTAAVVLGANETTRIAPPPGPQKADVAISASPVPATSAPATSAPATSALLTSAPPNRGRRWGRAALVVVAVAALVTSLTIVGIASGAIDLPSSSAGRSPAPSTVAQTASPTADPLGPVIIADPLSVEKLWHPKDDKPNNASCTFAGALIVTRSTGGSYRCLGPQDVIADFTATVDVKLRDEGSCAAVWFRFDGSGYALRICADAYSLVAHGATGAAAIKELGRFPLTTPIAYGEATTVGIAAAGTNLTFTRDGRPVGSLTDTMFNKGRVVLGIFQESKPETPPPYSVLFSNIEIRKPAG
ncbi:serine/threonine protein kinase [Dactylosporangium sp. CA-152071]|uniref:serine/threonine protein kinase n=1 Tax=Dactylosporangium sp. CA-152071 TaxID=3239933 RepID=UPI003D8DC289